LKYFDEALLIDENVDCYLFDKASCYLHLLEYDKAYETYKKAFELNPHSGDIANADIFLDFIKDLKSVELISD
jgi:Tfp pilus assembly protein PilF